MPIKKDEETLKNNSPHIVVGTPGRLLALGRSNQLKLKAIKFFVLDECDKMIGDAGQLFYYINSHVDMYHKIIGDFFLRHAKRCPGNFQNDTTRETSDDVQRYFAKRSSCCLQEVYAGSKDLLRSENMLYIVVCDCDEFQNGSIIKWLRQSSWLPRRHLHFLHPIHISQKSTTELLI